MIKELPKYPPSKQELFSSQEQLRTQVSREKNRNGGLTSETGYHGAVIPMQPNPRKNIRIDPETMAKVELMIEKQSGGYSCTQCEYTTKSKQHMKEHVEKHIEGLEYPCKSCDKVLRSSHSLRDHKSKCVNFLINN